MGLATLKKSTAVILASATALVLSFAAHAQGYPTKTIRIVVPYPAGGTTDFFARTVFPSSRGKPLKLRTEVNGHVRQDSDTSDLYVGIEKLVSYISQVMTLFPGDIIATGSPAGVAFFMKPPGFLKPGDRVRWEIEGIGATDNEVRAE
jgi:hypothetical protein